MQTTHQKAKQLTLCSFLLAITIIACMSEQYWGFMANGTVVECHFIFIIFVTLILTWRWQIAFLVGLTLAQLFLISDYVINPWQYLLDYGLPNLIIFLIVNVYHKIIVHTSQSWMLLLGLGFCLIYFSHVLSGMLYFTTTYSLQALLFSASFNFPCTIITFLLTSFVSIMNRWYDSPTWTASAIKVYDHN